jgi:hypothetical protein
MRQFDLCWTTWASQCFCTVKCRIKGGWFGKPRLCRQSFGQQGGDLRSKAGGYFGQIRRVSRRFQDGRPVIATPLEQIKDGCAGRIALEFTQQALENVTEHRNVNISAMGTGTGTAEMLGQRLYPVTRGSWQERACQGQGVQDAE